MNNSVKEQKGFLAGFLNKVEIAGNKLPNPAILFLYGILLIIALSVILSSFGVSVADIRPESSSARSKTGIIVVNNLLNFDGLTYMLTNLITNFVTFAPFGVVVIAFLGVSLAEKSGFIEVSLRGLVNRTPKILIVAVVALLGIMSNIASDVGYVVLIPLGATIFLAFKKNPMAGIVVAFVGVSGGFSANLLIGTLDPLLSGIAQESAKLIDPAYLVGPQVNYYFMAASTFLIMAIILVINKFVTEPQLGIYTSTEKHAGFAATLTPAQKKGFRLSLLYIVALSVLMYLSVKGDTGFLLSPKTKSLDSAAPFYKTLIAFVFLYFAGVGIIYGWISGTFKAKGSIIKAMEESIKEIAPYIVLVFIMAQFINYFNYTNLGIMFAIGLTNMLKSVNFVGPSLLISFIYVAAIANLFMGSASAKWSIFAPIFIPAFMLLGYSPEVTQSAYRIGDSATNIISPLLPYLGIILFTLKKYNPLAGVGTLISLTLPYSVALLVIWPIFFYFWVFIFQLPIGPGAQIFYP